MKGRLPRCPTLRQFQFRYRDHSSPATRDRCFVLDTQPARWPPTIIPWWTKDGAFQMTKHVHWLSSEPSNKLVHREVKGQPAHSKWRMRMLLLEAVVVVVRFIYYWFWVLASFRTQTYLKMPPPKKTNNKKQTNKQKQTHTHMDTPRKNYQKENNVSGF